MIPDRSTVTHVAATLLTALAECPDGTREGLAYAGLMGVCDLHTFQFTQDEQYVWSLTIARTKFGIGREVVR